MRRLSILLLLVSLAHAEVPKSCQLLDDTAEMIMQLRQSGLSLDDIDLNPEALSQEEALLLKAMIAEAKRIPIYKIAFAQEMAIEDFQVKWQRECMVSYGNRLLDKK